MIKNIIRHIDLSNYVICLIFISLIQLPIAIGKNNFTQKNSGKHHSPINSIICPSDIIVYAAIDECGAFVFYNDPTVLPPFGNLTLVEGLPSGSLFPETTTTQTFLASDGSGNVVSCSFDITVIPTADDSDCDGVSDNCDVCDGGDDSIDENGDGLPDCANFPGYLNIYLGWACSPYGNGNGGGNGNGPEWQGSWPWWWIWWWWWINHHKPKKYFVCHKPNTHHERTLCVSKYAIPAHMGHGDFLGPCTSCSNQNRNAEPDQELSESVLRLYPNPATNEINISVQGAVQGEIQIHIYHITGQLVWEEKIDLTGTGLARTVPLNNQFVSGMYTVHVTQNDRRLSGSLIIDR